MNQSWHRWPGVTKKYGEITALRDVNLNVHAGELLAVLGPNGGRQNYRGPAAVGLAKPGSGRATVFGHDPRGRLQPVHALAPCFRLPSSRRR